MGADQRRGKMSTHSSVAIAVHVNTASVFMLVEAPSAVSTQAIHSMLQSRTYFHVSLRCTQVSGPVNTQRDGKCDVPQAK